MNFRALEKSIRVLEKSWKSPGNLFLKKGTNPGKLKKMTDHFPELSKQTCMNTVMVIISFV